MKPPLGFGVQLRENGGCLCKYISPVQLIVTKTNEISRIVERPYGKKIGEEVSRSGHAARENLGNVVYTYLVP